MYKPIRVVVPDSGVLISFAAGGVLDLLMTFKPGIELIITDVVEYEVTSNLQKSGASQIRSFLSKYAAKISIAETSFNEQLAAIRKGANFRLPSDAGETSIYSFVTTVKTSNPGVATLVLFEDSWFIEHDIAKPGNVHLLSTMAFLEGLEKLVPKFSAKAVIDKICEARPNFHRVRHEVGAGKVSSGTEWASTVDVSPVAAVAKKLRRC